MARSACARRMTRLQVQTRSMMIAQVITALGVIVLVLLQHGKGADMGAAFGGGASGVRR